MSHMHNIMTLAFVTYQYSRAVTFRECILTQKFIFIIYDSVHGNIYYDMQILGGEYLYDILYVFDNPLNRIQFNIQTHYHQSDGLMLFIWNGQSANFHQTRIVATL